ncbi:MAG: hypothetical protein WAX49_02650, partial [Trichococcus flocculiformis]
MIPTTKNCKKKSLLKHYDASKGSMKMIQLLAPVWDHRKGRICNPLSYFLCWLIFVPRDYF